MLIRCAVLALILLNSHHEQVEFKLPSMAEGTTWKSLLDTHALPEDSDTLTPGSCYHLEGRSLSVLRLILPTAPESKELPKHVAAEVTESVPLVQVAAPPTETSGGSTMNRP